jgi:SAM-dependent methyltransferase
MPPTSDSADAFADFERDGWESGRASPYHRGLGAMTSRPVPVLLDAAAVGPGSAVLDVATGPGYAAAVAAERGADVVAVDFSSEMVELAAELYPDVEFRQADANALPFEDGTFDAVVSNLLMPHVSDLPAVVRELARVVRPGGRVALSTWDPEPPTYLRAMFEVFAASGAVPPPELPPGPAFFQYGAADEFRELLTGAGLEEPAVESVPFTHRIDDVDGFIADLIAGTVRMGYMLESQPAEVQTRFRDGFAERVEGWRSGAGYELPCAIKVGSGTRP